MGVSFLVNFLQFLLIALWALVFGRMLMSWVDPAGRNQISAFLIQATEPMLAPVRRMLPQSGHDRLVGVHRLLIVSASSCAPSEVLSSTDVRFAVRLTPRSAVNRVEGVVDGVLELRVTAPAVEGAANAALVALLADELRGRPARRPDRGRGDQPPEAGGRRRRRRGGRRCPVARPAGMIRRARCRQRGAATLLGRLAQWLEHTVHIRGVTGSNPVSPTIVRPNSWQGLRALFLC